MSLLGEIILLLGGIVFLLIMYALVDVLHGIKDRMK